MERTMGEIVRLGNIQREKMPGELANAGYFHLFQQVLFYYPDGKRKLHEWMEKEFPGSGAMLPGASNTVNCVKRLTFKKLPLCSGRYSSDSLIKCLSPTASMSRFSESVSSIYMGC
ncbi:MAG: hypothetical protein V8T61_06490 [Alistipes inops]